MNEKFSKINYNLPWLWRYPFVRSSDFLSKNVFEKKHIVFTIANHFEPSWMDEGGHRPAKEQLQRLKDYYKIAKATGETLSDSIGTKFSHTNFFPIEQYDENLLDILSQMQSEGLGETEIHLHHGVEKPDTSENLRTTLVKYRDIFAEKHKLLSRLDGKGIPRYAFVHGNLALANSCGGKYCGVDDEMQILQETGCYVDMTLPSAPDESQVPIINQIYECDLPLNQPVPHRKGKNVKVRGNLPQLPLIFTGPLIFNWTRLINGIPFPRIDDGCLSSQQTLDLARFKRWVSANVTVEGKSDWVFVKLYCHGFFDKDQSTCIGERAKRFFSEIIEEGEKTSNYKVYFATAREAFNMVSAAIDGKSGSPGEYRNYRMKTIMSE